MAKLPDDVAASLVRGIGAYIRDLPPHELPSKLRRFKTFRPQALMGHRDVLLGALDDDAFRARIGHWLKTEKPSMSKEEARLLGIAASRDDGWEDELRGAAKTVPKERKTVPSQDEQAEVERDRARRAKDDARRAREELRSSQKETSAAIAALEARLAELEVRLAEAQEEAERERKSAERATEQLDRTQRRTKTETEKLKTERDEARKEARDLRRQLRTATSSASPPRKAPPPARKKVESPPRKRKALRVPKGRFEDDPETLRGWLARDDSVMVVDGYNVAKADGGYEELRLESQRERLVDAVFTLAKMTGTETIIVFDAQRVPGRRTKKTRRPVHVEWSRPGEIADDYIVKRLEELPPEPVILVTNDKELQDRGRALAATVATSQQLLALLR